MERLRLAWNFDGAVKSCLADRCYVESCLVGRCYARQISRSLRIWTDERRVVAPLGTMVASTDDWTDKDDADLFPEDGVFEFFGSSEFSIGAASILQIHGEILFTLKWE
ncbi:Serine/threonine-protein kinase HT1 [Hordeum vulgare]|nr:Serine/threonine-protein kinase HT1 [Hordeum vulgare]